MKKNKKIIIATAVLIVLLALVIFAWLRFGPSAIMGGKHIEVTVVHVDGSEKVFSYVTDSEKLRTPLEEHGLISGDESQYGLYIKTVDGETADENLQQWWCITKDGEMSTYGVDEIMIADGDRYEFTLTTGW